MSDTVTKWKLAKAGAVLFAIGGTVVLAAFTVGSVIGEVFSRMLEVLK